MVPPCSLVSHSPPVDSGEATPPELSRTLSPPTVEKGEEGAIHAPSGEVTVSLRLRWPLGLRMCEGMVVLRLAV